MDVEAETAEERLTLVIPPPLAARIQALLDNPELGFHGLAHFLRTAVRSFVAYKERQIDALRRDL